MLENNVICLLLDGKLKTASRWQKFVIESLSHSNDAFKWLNPSGANQMTVFMNGLVNQ